MQNFITSFCASKPSQIVNDRLGWDEGSPHRHDCHDPPHEARGGFVEDRSPPRRLPAVARSAPWKAAPVQVGLPGDATRKQRSTLVAGLDCWNNSRGKDYLRRNCCGNDCHPEREIHTFAAIGAAEIALGCGVRPRSEQNWRRLLVPEELASGCLQLVQGLVVQAIWYIVTNDHTATEIALMGTPAKTLDQLSKVVVRSLTGGRKKGYVSDYFA